MQRGGKNVGPPFVSCPTDACCGQVLEAIVEKGYKGCEFSKIEYEMPEEGRKELIRKVRICRRQWRNCAVCKDHDARLRSNLVMEMLASSASLSFFIEAHCDIE